jgi:hypothetical protein
VIDDNGFFIRGCLEIPTIGVQDPFLWGVWVSLTKSNFEREQNLLNDQNRTGEPPYFGWLSTRIEIYPDTAALKTKVHTLRVGLKPRIELQPTDHPLSPEQRNGMTVDRVIEIAEKMQHGWKHPKWNAKAL